MDYCHEFQTAQSQFHFNLFNEIALAKANESFVYSPIGISIAFIMALLGANTQTKNETKTKMGLQNITDEQITNCLKYTLNELDLIDNKNLALSNNIFIHNNYDFTEEYLNKIKNFEYLQVQKINFLDKENTTKEINNFVANKTNIDILNAIDSSSINNDTRLLLLNSINFEALWAYEFHQELTKQSDFNLDDGRTTKLNIMKQENYFKSIDDIYYQFISLPFVVKKYDYYSYSNKKVDDLRMYILLPSESLNLNEFLKALTYKKLNKIINLVNKKTKKLTKLSLPKFSATNNLNVSEIAKKVGINELFKNDLTEMVNNSSLKISDIIQKTLIKVVESGTVASAVKEIKMDNSMAKKHINFNANHPFMYVIADKKKNILFNGVFRGN